MNGENNEYRKALYNEEKQLSYLELNPSLKKWVSHLIKSTLEFEKQSNWKSISCDYQNKKIDITEIMEEAKNMNRFLKVE